MQTGCNWLRTKHNCQRNETVLFLRIWQTLFFKSFQKRFKAKLYISTTWFRSLPFPSPVIPFFFCSRPYFIDKLMRKHLLHRLMSGMMSCLLLHFVYSLFQSKVSAVKNAWWQLKDFHPWLTSGLRRTFLEGFSWR